MNASVATNGTVAGTGSDTPQLHYKRGAVYTRSIVPGEHGQPQFVFYDPDSGAELEFIGEKYGDLATARVVSATDYRSWFTRLGELQSLYPDLVIMTAAEYAAATFETATGENIAKPALDDTHGSFDTVSVVLRPVAQRYKSDGSDLILLKMPVDARQPLGDGEDVRTLLLDSTGKIHRKTKYNIGFRVAYYGTDSDYDGQGSRSPEDRIYGPLGGVPVNIAVKDKPFPTNSDGRYTMQYYLPTCTGFTIMYNADLTVKLNYQRFNPHGGEPRQYILRRENQDQCNGLGIFGTFIADMLNATPPEPNVYFDFPVDLIILAGRARITNRDPEGGDEGGAIEVGEAATRYDAGRAALTRVSDRRFDFDGDGINDTTALGRLVTDAESETTTFRQAAADGEVPEIQGVWLSTGKEAVTFDNGQASRLPDVTRLPDWSTDFDHKALLSHLSEADFEQTDIYVFRESTGQLIMERKGLPSAGSAFAEPTGVNAESGTFEYTLRLLGPDGEPTGYGEFDAFQAAEGVVDARLYAREADHLRPGESVRIVAINRPTGYIGTTTTTLDAASEGGAGMNLAVTLGDLVMGPPNLKIWAQRHSEVEHGYTAGEEREHRIGAEGAALASDRHIDIITQWYDVEGRPLPEALGDYGYTARLARVVDANRLVPVEAVAQSEGAGNDLSEFSIRPGRHVQVIRLPEQQAAIGNQHLYVQVSGRPPSSEKRPNFGSSGVAEGILQYRPDHFVPVKVPVFDEKDTNTRLKAYRDARAANPELALAAPEAVYHWVYRPEFQFTVYGLRVDEIRREDVAQQTHNLLEEGAVAVISSDDRLVSVFYDLSAPTRGDESLAQLSAYSFDGERELVFALGEQELRATVGADGEVNFDDNIEHLSSLVTDDDYLTLRLYANNDTNNLLWEYAFGRGLLVSYQLPHEEHFIAPVDGSDEAVEGVGNDILYRLLGGVRLKYSYELPPQAEPISYTWAFTPVGEGDPGRFCADHYSASDTCESTTTRTGAELASVYWEPAEWSTSVNYNGTLTVRYILNGIEKSDRSEFRVASRELGPAEGDAEPMHGSDVAMLEEMLWALGISPQKSGPAVNRNGEAYTAYKAGSEGARINSDRGGAAGWTMTCAGERADDRSIFYPDVADCPTGHVATELMVKRFNARNLESRGLVSLADVNNARGAADVETLAWLARDWRLYMNAYAELQLHRVFERTTGNMAAWVEEAVEIWQAGTGATVPASLTEANYNAVLRAAGLADNSRHRRELLRSWLEEETRYHWGDNPKHYQTTAFRMVEGGADENGSLSFSQLLYHYRFGPNPCAAHGEAQLNLYHPRDNLRTMVIHTASNAADGTNTRNCEGGLHKAFVTNTLRLSYGHGGGMADLEGYIDNASGELVALNLADLEGDYEALAKGIGIYNGNGTRNAPLFTANSWPKLLKTREYQANSSRNSATVCHSCKYSLLVRNRAGVLAGQLRRYVWRPAVDNPEDGLGVDLNGDGVIADAPGAPETTTPWCFVYGESDWVNPAFSVEDDEGDSVGAKFSDYRDRAAINVVHRISCGR